MSHSQHNDDEYSSKPGIDVPNDVTEFDFSPFPKDVSNLDFPDSNGMDLDFSVFDTSRNSSTNSLENLWINDLEQPQVNIIAPSEHGEIPALENYVFGDIFGLSDLKKSVPNNEEKILKSVDNFNTLMESAWNYNALGKLTASDLESLNTYSDITPGDDDSEVAKSYTANIDFIESSQNLDYSSTPTFPINHQEPDFSDITNDSDNNKPIVHENSNGVRRSKRNSNNVKKEIDTNHFRIKEPFSNPNIKLEISSSSVTCLSISIDYKKYTGVITNVDYDHPDLVNNYCKPHDQAAKASKAIELYSNTEGASSSVSALRQRVKYTRMIDEIVDLVDNIVYKSSSVYNLHNPYEPQYYRFELDHDGNLINETKCGLCPYCMELRFLPFKNSSYLSHLTLEHGIFSNNFLTPNGLYYGRYNITKREKISGSNKRHTKSRDVDAIQCPHCFEVTEVGCWSMKSNKLLSYFRHFKNKHGDEIQSKEVALQKPSIQTRGRTLKVIE